MKKLAWLMATSILLLAGCNTGGKQVKEQQANEQESTAKDVNVQPENEQQATESKATEKQTSETKTSEKSGALITAVQNNDSNRVKEIVASSPKLLNETNSKKESALLIATHNDNLDIAKLLIDAGADVNQQDAIQDSPYLYAGAQGKTAILAYMIDNAEPNQKVYNRFGGNTIIPAAEKGHLQNVKLLLKDGKVDIDHQNNFGYTALIEAVALTDGSEVFQEIVKELLAYNANKDLRDSSGKNALEYAESQGYSEMIALLK